METDIESHNLALWRLSNSDEETRWWDLSQWHLCGSHEECSVQAATSMWAWGNFVSVKFHVRTGSLLAIIIHVPSKGIGSTTFGNLYSWGCSGSRLQTFPGLGCDISVHTSTVVTFGHCNRLLILLSLSVRLKGKVRCEWSQKRGNMEVWTVWKWIGHEYQKTERFETCCLLKCRAAANSHAKVGSKACENLDIRWII